MVVDLVKGTDLGKLLDSYGIESSSLGNDLIQELAEKIVYKNLVELDYVPVPNLDGEQLSERRESFLITGLTNIALNGYRERILGVPCRKDNIMRLATGNENIQSEDGRRNYQQTMDGLVEKLENEAHRIILEYEDIDLLYCGTKNLQTKEEKLSRYQRVMNLDPKNALSRLYAAAILVGKGELPEAERYLKRALSLRPKDPRILNQMGIVADRQRNYDEAESRYREAVKSDPTMTRPIYNLGLLFQKKRDYKQARDMFAIAAARGNEKAKEKLRR